MTIELLTIGSELLAGRTLNSNALFIGDELSRAGLTLSRQTSIPDQHEIIVATLRECIERADWVIVSGGLGPTNDDVTKNALSHVFERPLIFHPEILEALKARYQKLGRTITPLLDTQALLPKDAEFIPNEYGTAVGIVLTEGRTTVVAVPGVPREMEPMVRDVIIPRIAAQAKTHSQTITWSTVGWPESRLYETLSRVMADNPEVEVAFLPSELGVRLRFTTHGPDAGMLLTRFTDAARPLVAESLYAEDDVGLEVVVGRMLQQRGFTIVLAESCTGGLIAKRLTDVPGSSAYVWGGYVTYDNRAKTDMLGVNPELIAKHGAVSEEVVTAMAKGAIARSGADCSIAVTGIAGPDGGTPDKPVGTVWLATAIKGDSVSTKRFNLLGDREVIRARAAQAALNMLRGRLL